ncbi:hypothetical protein NS228_06205 [Methylobacterium indicum]|uniref:hypothetical protein n=1 Tax=Methylobacterium indicum TaxID=1775910 RepID=UPI0007342485|nr:hypothetical protein [Methylobacterium indicum]KTS30860.1 hypothetical protein NS229_14625 [Methylobacterium indicum]KTS41552.1 hypothetical protein NS228_06205 [Methylobacterium indicum]KTS45167.1 hypothetical protein NS230_24195 [Methylobacterium indicum]
MSRSSARRARVAGVIDRQWGESFTLSPRSTPPGDRSARPGPDPSRAPFDFIGRFTSAADEIRGRDRNVSIQMTRPMVSSSPTVTVVRTNLRGEIREGDLLKRDETGETFIVGQIPDGRFERLVIKLRAGA